MAYNEDIFPLWIQRLNNLPPVITISPNYVNLH